MATYEFCGLASIEIPDRLPDRALDRLAAAIATIDNPETWIHFLDPQRPTGIRRAQDGRRITQWPVICALDVVELDAGVADDVTYRPEAVTCPDCLARLEAGRNG